MVDPSRPEPLFAQVAASVRRAVHDGDLAPGDQLTPAREVAGLLDVNMHTVLRAYQQLRDEGLIELRRGRGAIVRARAADTARLDDLIRQLHTEGARLGMNPDDLARLVSKGDNR